MWRFVFVLIGLFLAACQAAEPIEITREQLATAVLASTSTPTTIIPTKILPPTHTPTSTTIPPTHTPIVYTPTPVPTETAVPTHTPTPIPLPIQPAKVNALPLISHDLLFMADNALKLWRHEQGDIVILLPSEPTALLLPHYTTDTTGEKILLVQQIMAEAPSSRLLLVFRDGDQQLLWQTAAPLLDFALSPDGQTAAFVLGDAERPSATIYLLDTTNPTAPTAIADCDLLHVLSTGYELSVGCNALSWTPDSQSLLWQEAAGVWQGGLTMPPRLLWVHDYFEDDPPRTYAPTQEWAPNGRYLLWQARWGKGITLRVFDIETETLIEIPHSLTAIDHRAYWIWTQDSHLFTVRPPARFDDETDIMAEIWQVGETELLLAESLAIPRLEHERPTAPTQLADGRFTFALVDNNSESALARGLYLLNDLDASPQKVNALPPILWAYPEIVWLPDSTAAIYYILNTGQILFVPTDGSALIDLTQIMGQGVNNLAWLP